MNSFENTFDLIGRYLNKELSERERSEFESRLKTDKEFADMFEIQYVSYQIVVGKSLLDLKAKMQKDLNGNDSPIDKNKKWKYFGGGAAIVIIAFLLYLFFKGDEPKPHQQKVIERKDSVINIPPSQERIDTTSLHNIPDTVPVGRSIQKAPIEKENNLCKDTLISFSCQARAACEKQSNGAIEVDLNTIKLGKGPYQFSIYSDHGFIPDAVIGDLKSGRYNLYVKDTRGCIRRLNVKIDVPNIDCTD